MQGAERTTRQRIADKLREEPLRAGTIAHEFSITTGSALSHVEHIAQSLSCKEEELLVAPPECHNCGFSEFDHLINRPSRCPNCKSMDVEEPMFKID